MPDALTLKFERAEALELLAVVQATMNAIARNRELTVGAALVNTGGEYVVALYGLTSGAAGQFTTLPIPCEEGQTQTTIGGNGTLTLAT